MKIPKKFALRTLLFSLAPMLCVSEISYGQMGSFSRSGGGGNDFALTIPIIAPESTASLEVNLRGLGVISVEGSFRRETELLDKEEIDAMPTATLLTREHQWRLLFSRYSNPMRMSGLFWTMGVGYRQSDVRWRKGIEDGDSDILAAYLDEQSTVYHEARLSGMTGHLRLGYRYVGESVPFIVGGYIGIRHFQSGIKDTKQEDPTVAPLTTRESNDLRRRFMTSFEPALSLGWAF